MIVLINGQNIDESRVVGSTLEEILADLQESFIPEDHIVREVRLNGATYQEDLPHAAIEIPRDTIQALELFLISSEEISIHFLAHSSLHINSLLEGIPKIAEMFRLGDEQEANEHYLRFLESLHLFVNMAEKASQTVGVNFDLPVGQRESLNERLTKLSATLSQMLSIQEQTDWVYLADLLEYELSPELEALCDLLPQLTSNAH